MVCGTARVKSRAAHSEIKLLLFVNFFLFFKLIVNGAKRTHPLAKFTGIIEPHVFIQLIHQLHVFLRQLKRKQLNLQ